MQHLEQYFGLWCVVPERFHGLVESVQGMNLVTHLAQLAPEQLGDVGRREYEMLGDDVAVIELCGVLSKYGSSMSQSSSTVATRRQLRLAANDAAVRAILLLIDSPGGTSAGTQDLADEILAAREKKTVWAYCEDLCASAAYWVASQCEKIFANRSAMVGAIGTYAVVQDQSKAAERLGVQVHVIRAGAFKGAGEPGSEITEEHLADWQRIVDETNEFFVRGVASGRNLDIEKTRELADGRVHIGSSAMALGLLDGVQTLDETVLQIISSSNPKKGKAMSATYKDLKATLPKANAEFLTQCLDEEMTVEQARDAWVGHLEQLNAQLESKAKAKAEVPDDEDEEDEEDEPPKGRKSAKTSRAKNKARREETAEEDEEESRSGRCRQPGVEPVGTRRSRRRQNDPSGDAVQDFNALVAECRRTNPQLSRREAIHAAARHDPQLHKDYVQATNSSDPATRGLIDSLLNRRPVATNN